MNVLVTGAAGTIGTAVVRALAGHGHRVHAVDRIGHAAPVADDMDADMDAVVWTVAELSDPAVAAAVTEGAEAVVHLAAIPYPGAHPDHQVFLNNSGTTFCVLDAAARAGVTRAVIASSVSVLGLVFAPEPLDPPELPVSEACPLQVTDAYALSKQVDESIAAMIHRTWGMTVLAYRFPNVLGTERLRERGESARRDPSTGQRELWAYLHLDDAARAVRLGIEADVEGVHVINVVASESLGDVDVAALTERFFPRTPILAPILPGHTAYTTEKAEAHIRFRSEIHWTREVHPHVS